MGGAAVFPGGALSAADLDPRWDEHSALSRRDAAAATNDDDGASALGAYVCALREAFEEVGFLIGSGSIEAIERIEADDAAVFLDSCIEHSVVLATDRLVPAGRWVTPLGSPVRFDTMFFLAAADHGWEPVPDPNEVAGCMWMRPADALAELASGNLMMAPPTVEMLQRLEAYATRAEAFEGLKGQGLKGAGNVLSVRLSPLVHVVLAPNPGLMTGPGTNTYVVNPGEATVIDPAVDDDEYFDAVMEAAGRVERILVTHRHPDHVGGIERLVERTGAQVGAWGTEPAGGVQVHPIDDGEEIRAGRVVLSALHTPGHASDHLCFFLESAASLFSGDNILGEGTAVIAPPDGNMSAFLAGLRRLDALRIDRIYPGHFRPLDGGNEVIRHLIQHRLERESMIVASLADGPLTDEEIVERVYTDTPAQLHPVARYSVRAHLDKLSAEGRVRSEDDRWSIFG
jgi:glyoxylase-like metal-dependent hydrolase (beta-lactamase superfamily II)/8-oxo-dGTP pyrophosphatase MutT (NUDIX family)